MTSKKAIQSKAGPGTSSAGQANKQKLKRAAQTPPPGWRDPLAQQQPLVSGRWLVRALLLVVGVAAFCAYLTLCLLFYQGQWQVVFHPSRTITTTPAALGVKYDDVRFDYTGAGIAQLAGWWIPAAPGARYASRTLFFLHDGRGSLSDAAAQLKTLHSLGVNVFAFDYRGFGQSAAVHPSEERVYEDAGAAWTYLTDIRHLDPRSIVVYGAGLGATVAAETAIRHPGSPGLVLENPAPPTLSQIAADSRTSMLPIRLLFRDRFELGRRLRSLGITLAPSTEKIVLSGTLSPAPVFFRQEGRGAGPKFLLLLGPAPANDPRYLPALDEFLSGS